MVRPTGNRIYRRIIPVLALLLLVSVLLGAVDYPAARGYVNDFAGIISASDAAQIEAVARSLEEHDIQLAVVSVTSLEGLSVDQYTMGLAEAWGVGTAGEDLGVILLLAVEDRSIRIEVGYGLEGDLPDGLVGSILDQYVMEHLRANNFSRGLLEGSRAIAATLADRRELTLRDVSVQQYAVEQESRSSDALNFLWFLFVLLFVFGRGRLWPLLLLGGHRGRSSRHRGGGFGAPRGGGGFGGFGGGGFGGGGASRSF